MSNSMLNTKNIVVGYFVAVLLAASVFVYQLWSSYQHQMESAQSTVENLTWVLQQRLDATLRRTDATLSDFARSTAPESLNMTVRAKFEAEYTSALAVHRVKFPEMAAFRIIDANGDLLYTSDPVSNFANLADRPYFMDMRDKPDAGLVYSDVQISRFTGQTVIVIGRPIRNSSGQFLGACIAVLDLSSYVKLFDSLNIGPHGLISIRRLDSRLVLRKPPDPTLVNKPIKNPIHSRIEAGQDKGVILYAAVSDGIERLFAYRRVPDYPFYFIVGVATDDFLSAWRRQVLVATCAGLMALLLTSALLFSLLRARVREAENARSLEEREHNLRYVMEATGEGIWNWDIEQGQVRVNDSFRSILAISEQHSELTIAGIGQYVVGEDQAIYQRALRACLKGEASLWLECRFQREQREIIWILLRGNVVRRSASGQALRMVGSIADITGRKNSEEQLRSALHAAEDANRAKSAFLAAMSHELRTPLNGILGMAHLLLAPELTDEERREYAATVNTSGRSLLTILNDILDLSKIEAGKLDLTYSTFDPQQILREVAALFTEMAQSKGVKFVASWRGPAGQHYRGDPLRLKQMLSNLVSNAIKFTAQGSIRVEGAEVERGPSEALLEIAVTDSGIGISADKQFKLFQAFSQVDDSTTRAHGGTGLGLSIVRRLAQLMGGDVGVDSEVGKGSTFWFRARVMLVSEAEKSLQAPHLTPTLFPSATPSAATMHVLVVEDNPVNQKVIAAYLKKLAVQFEVVDNGQEAVSVIVGGGTPDLVLMDCQMPVMDGYEATRRIRQWELENARAPIAIIALTAGAFEEDRGLCFAAGMSDFLAKPVSMDKLIATLARWLPAKPNGSDSLPAGALDFAPSDGSLPDVPGFDVRSALARMDNDVAQYLEFLEIFRDGNAEEISGLAEAITRGDATEARRRAHSIKGSAGTIGAVKLQAAAAQLENGLKESQFDKELEAVVETEWQQVLASLAVLLRMPNAKAQTSKLDREKNDE